VHQLRVASRRLRAFVDMFGSTVDPKLGDALTPRLRQVTRAMREIRDSDVLSSNLESRLARATSEPERVALNHLLDRTKRRRRKHVTKAQRSLGEVEFGEVARLLRSMLDEIAVRSQAPSGSYELLAHVAYQPIVDAAREARARVEPTSTPEELHQLRLSLKQLRYASELIQPALGERFAEIQNRAKRLQTVLGDHQDHAELERLVTRRQEKALQSRRETLSVGLNGVLEQVRGERARCQRLCFDECSKLCGQRLFAQVEV
jgi:CHAD domain-containing protein